MKAAKTIVRKYSHRRPRASAACDSTPIRLSTTAINGSSKLTPKASSREMTNPM